MKFTGLLIIAQRTRQSVTHLDLPVAATGSGPLLENSPFGQAMALVLPMIIAVGFVIIIGLKMMQVDLARPLERLIYRTYFLFPLAYIVWLVHFSLKVPFFIPIEAEFALILGLGSALVLGLYFLDSWLENRDPYVKEAETHCPHCHARMLKVASHCPKCGKETS